MRLLALVAVLWSLVPLPIDGDERGPAACPMNVRFKSYPVSGLNKEEVRRSLLANGPRDSRGKRRFAAADWRIEWRWQTTEQGFVVPDSISISCSAEVTMPRFVPTRGTTPELVSAWYAFAGRVRAHELNHVRHAERRAWLVKERLVQAHRDSGPLTPSRANEIAHAVLRDIQALDDAYDSATQHGKAEGAWAL